MDCKSENAVVQMSQKKSHTKRLSDLDNHCMEKIFKFLHPNDLAAFSRTCLQYSIWSEQYFNRKRLPGEIEISVKNKTVGFNFEKAERFEILFCSSVRFLRVQMINSNAVEVLQFVRGNCTKNLIQLRLLNAGDVDYVELNSMDGSIIAGQLKNVQTLQLCGIALKDIYDKFLKYCENLKTLFISPYSGLPIRLDHLDKSLMSHRFSHLETFVFVDFNQNSTMDIDFSGFLRNHPKLKAVVTNQISFIKCLCLAEVDLRYAAMVFHSEADVLDNWRLLEICFKRKFIKSLEVVISAPLTYGTVKSILNFKLVDAIHWYFNSPFINLKTQLHIRKLSALLFVETHVAVTSQIIYCFPRLETLWIFTDHNLKEILMPLIGRIETLKHLYVRSLNVAPLSINMDDVLDLHTERLNRNHNSPVIIHLHKESLEVTKELPSTIQESSLVKVKVCGGDNFANKIPFYFNDFETSLAYLNEVVNESS